MCTMTRWILLDDRMHLRDESLSDEQNFARRAKLDVGTSMRAEKLNFARHERGLSDKSFSDEMFLFVAQSSSFLRDDKQT